jgi:signal transduction histidine kinase
MSTSQLTPRTNLQFLKNQAKRLLKDCKSGDPIACSRFRERLPQYRESSDSDIQVSGITLVDAQSVIAIEHGFVSWAKLKHRAVEPTGLDTPEPGKVLSADPDLVQRTRQALLTRSEFCQRMSAVFQDKTDRLCSAVNALIDEMAPAGKDTNEDLTKMKMSIRHFRQTSTEISTSDHASGSLQLAAVEILESTDPEELVDVLRGRPDLADEIGEAIRHGDAPQSHVTREVKTPLMSVQALCRLILEREGDRIDVTTKDRLNSAASMCEDLLTVVDDVRDLTRAANGLTNLQPVECNVSELVSQVIEYLSDSTSEGVDLVGNLDDDISAEIDAGRFRQALYGVVSNAVRLTETGWVSVVAKQVGDEFVVVVEDTGPGIPKDQLLTVFEGRWREPRDESSRLGVGLPLARRLVELQGGSAGVESEIGKGSKFTLRLPRVYPG